MSEKGLVEGRAGNLRRVLTYLIIAVVLFGGGYATRTYTSKTRSATVSLSTRVLTVTSSNATQSISASGTIEPATQENVNFSVAGTVSQVMVTAGETVQAGQTLASLVTAPLAEAVAQAEANLAGVQAKLASDQAASSSSAQISADEANITAASDNLATAQANLGDATLTSPSSGVISAVNVIPGGQVSQNSAASPEFTLISAGSWVVAAGVADADISQVKDGEQVSIVPQGTADIGYGTVSSIGLVATASGGVATFPVNISVTGSPAGFYAGVPAQVTITTQVVANATIIPILAIYGSSTSPYVKLVTSSGLKNQPITLGATSAAGVTVTSGIRPGDRIEERVPRFAGLAAGRGGGGLGAGGFGGGGGLGAGGFGGGGGLGG